MTRASIAIAHRVIDSLWHRNEPWPAEVAPNAPLHLQGRALDRQQFHQVAVSDLQSALPDLRMRIRDTLSEPATQHSQREETEVVALRMSCDGTHTGVLFGVPASGENVSFNVLMWLRIQDTQVTAVQLYWNQFAAREALVAARQRAAATTASRAHPGVP